MGKIDILWLLPVGDERHEVDPGPDLVSAATGDAARRPLSPVSHGTLKIILTLYQGHNHSHGRSHGHRHNHGHGLSIKRPKLLFGKLSLGTVQEYRFNQSINYNLAG